MYHGKSSRSRKRRNSHRASCSSFADVTSRNSHRNTGSYAEYTAQRCWWKTSAASFIFCRRTTVWRDGCWNTLHKRVYLGYLCVMIGWLVYNDASTVLHTCRLFVRLLLGLYGLCLTWCTHGLPLGLLWLCGEGHWVFGLRLTMVELCCAWCSSLCVWTGCGASKLQSVV